MRHLELYAGGGASAFGIVQAGASEVVAVDVHLRRDLPPTDRITWVKADARDVLQDLAFLRTFDTLGGSPPCQPHSRTKHLRDAQGKSTSKMDMLDETVAAFEASGRPYLVENVEDAPLRRDVTLCGSMFPELSVTDETGRRWLRRHRIFRSNVPLVAPGTCCTCFPGCSKPGCGHRAAGVRALGVYAAKADDIPSGGSTARTLEQGRELMGAPWMSWAALVEAIPPAYTRWLWPQLAVAAARGPEQLSLI